MNEFKMGFFGMPRTMRTRRTIHTFIISHFIFITLGEDERFLLHLSDKLIIFN